MAIICCKSFEPTQVFLPDAGISIEIGCSKSTDLDDLERAYIKSSPAGFLREYLKKVKRQGRINVSRLSVKDLKLLISVCLKKEGISLQLHDNENKEKALVFFRDTLIGVPYNSFLSQKMSLQKEFEAECNQWLKSINFLLSKNEGELNNSNYLKSLHDEKKKQRLFRLKQNIETLKTYVDIIGCIRGEPDIYILRAIKYRSFYKENKFRNAFMFWELKSKDPKFLDFPLRWCGFLSHDIFNELYKDWQRGKDVIKDMIDSLQGKNNYSHIVNKLLNNCIIKQERKKIIQEGLACFQEKRFAAAVAILLPQIEGLLWDLAEHKNSKRQFIFKPNSGEGAYQATYYEIDKNGFYKLNKRGQKHYTDMSIEDLSLLKLKRDKGGKILKLGSVKRLVEESAMRFYLYCDLLEHLCGELFVERNEILHGRNLEFGTLNNAAMKVLAVHAVACEFD